MPAQFSLCLHFSDFASDSVTGIGLLGTSSVTQWVILLYWVPPDRVLLRFCVTEPDAELFPYGEKGVWPDGSALNVFPSGEKGVWPDESALNVFPYGEKGGWPDGNAETAKRKRAAPSSAMSFIGESLTSSAKINTSISDIRWNSLSLYIHHLSK